MHDGLAAIEQAERGVYDVMVLDVMMPKADGFRVLEKLRTSQRIPVVMLTARGEDIDRIVGLELGADDYVSKPCNPRELAARLRAVLRRSQPTGTEQTPLRCGDVELTEGLMGHIGKHVSLRITRPLNPPKVTMAAFEAMDQRTEG